MESSSEDPNRVVFTCNCGNDIVVIVDPDAENEVRCEKCGQDYRFYGRSVLRWSTIS
ncbi:MAG TPA: hypothetical protein VE177_00810 [Candidatus Binatus sp.]|nr:hypothetical protein [Candidatus Binatus sp.]